MTQVCSLCDELAHSQSPFDTSYHCPLNFSNREYTHVVIFNEKSSNAF